MLFAPSAHGRAATPAHLGALAHPRRMRRSYSTARTAYCQTSTHVTLTHPLGASSGALAAAARESSSQEPPRAAAELEADAAAAAAEAAAANVDSTDTRRGSPPSTPALPPPSRVPLPLRLAGSVRPPACTRPPMTAPPAPPPPPSSPSSATPCSNAAPAAEPSPRSTGPAPACDMHDRSRPSGTDTLLPSTAPPTPTASVLRLDSEDERLRRRSAASLRTCPRRRIGSGLSALAAASDQPGAAPRGSTAGASSGNGNDARCVRPTAEARWVIGLSGPSSSLAASSPPSKSPAAASAALRHPGGRKRP
eukprot:360282-Chlamydomonas_euryale.AAC.3